MDSGGAWKYFYDLALQQYTADQISTFQKNNEPIPLVLSYSEPLSINFTECAGNQTALEENMLFVGYTFELDNKNISADKILFSDYTNAEGRNCRNTLVIIVNWTSGVYLVSQSWAVNTTYNDGVSDWQAGSAGSTTYQITVP
jgi:hypothetical protein